MLDFVVDDASHFYQPSRATFECLFPKVRPDGLYIIEDWMWCFQDQFQGEDAPWREFDALPNLMLDLMEEMAVGNLIAEIKVHRHMLKVRRSKVPGVPVFQTKNRRGREIGLL
jgi:hypothetical protein